MNHATLAAPLAPAPAPTSRIDGSYQPDVCNIGQVGIVAGVLAVALPL